MVTIATLPRLAASQLSEMILAEESAGTSGLAIIDVRDDGKGFLPSIAKNSGHCR